MDFTDNLENLKKDIANTLLKFNEDVFSKHKEYIERAEVKLKKWEEGLQEREGKVEVKEKELAMREEDFIKLNERLVVLEQKEKEMIKSAHVDLTKCEKVTYIGNEKDFLELSERLRVFEEKEKDRMKCSQVQSKETAQGQNDKKCDIIQLNVGGWKFATTLSTLRAEKGSVLEKMFSDDFTVSRDNDGAVFIDRSGEYFKFILDYLHGNIVGLDDILFDERTRKRLIKEAEYYQLEGMKNILAFKPSSLEKEDDCDCKFEIIEIIENVIQNKEAIRNVLSESKIIERNTAIEGNLASVEDLKRQKLGDIHLGYHYRTTIPMTFENKIWDGKNLINTYFEHNIAFKQCSFVNVKFDYSEFRKNTNVCFHQCDLINASFCNVRFDGTIHFDGSDLRCCNFSNISDLLDKIQNGTVTFSRVKYVDTANFSNKAINTVIKLMNKIN